MATAVADISDGASNESDKCKEDGDNSSTPSQSSSNEQNTESKPVCLIVLGMAGSGKTTFVQVRLISHFSNYITFTLL